MNIEDIKEAIEVLEDASADMLMETGDENYYGEAIAVLRQALETEQKTAVSPGKGTGFIDARALGITVLQPALETKQKTAVSPDPDDPGVTPLYTAPVDGVTISEERVDETAERKHMTDLASVGEVGVWGEREWVGLTAEEIWQCNTAPEGHHVECHICVAHQNVLDFAEAIEAKLKEKNCG